MELGYRKNIAWQKNQQAILKVAKLIEHFPAKPHFKTLAGQLFASVSSIGANIAEGFSDFEGNEYQRYLKISLRSAYETDHWLTTLQSLMNCNGSNDLKLISEINGLNAETIKILLKTIKSIREKRKNMRNEG